MKGRRIIFPEQGRAAVEEFDVPPLRPGCVLIESECSVISPGTELACLIGQPDTPNVFPQHPGYSVVGRVVDVGPDVQRLSPGDRVLAYHMNHASHAVKEERDVARIESPALPSEEAVFLVIAAMSLQAVRKARLELGESVLVMGLGLLGLVAVQLARLSGGWPIIAMDFNPHRRRLALDFGADHALSPDVEDVGAAVRALTGGRGANVVVEVTGATEALKTALASAAPMGRVILLGCSRGMTEGLNFYQSVHRPGLAIIGAHNFVRPPHDSSPGHWTMLDDMTLLLRLLAAGRLRTRPLISEQVSPDAAPAVYRRMMDREPDLLGVVFRWRDAEAVQ